MKAESTDTAEDKVNLNIVPQSFSKPWNNQPQIPAKRKELFDKSTKDTVLETGVEKKRSFTLVLSGRTKISQMKVMQDL